MNQKIKEDLVKYLLKKTHVKKIAPNTDLIEKSIIDSFGIVEFISYIEKKYNEKNIYFSFDSYFVFINFSICGWTSRRSKYFQCKTL